MYNVTIDLSRQASKDVLSSVRYAKSKGFRGLETGYVLNGKALYDLSGDETEDIRDILISELFPIELVKAPPFETEDGQLKRFFRCAHLLSVKNILLPRELLAEKIEKGTGAALYISKLLRAASSFGMDVIAENASASYYKTNEKMEELASEAKDAGFDLKISIDPFEYVKEYHHPFFHMFYNSRIKNSVKMLRLHDGLYSGAPERLANGNCEIKELISILLARSFDGIFSVTPYLGEFSGVLPGEDGECDPGDILADFCGIAKRM